jgi:hypothetical protein
MLELGLIFLVDEVEWISPIVIQSNKGTDDIRVFLVYKILNSTFVHDTFMIPLSDKLLYHIAGKEAYSFTNGFLGYH